MEIVFRKDAPPAYLNVPATEKGKAGSWFASFGRVADWKQPAGSLPVRAVNFLVRREGEAVKVDVSLLTGRKAQEKEEFVTTLTMRENNKVIIRDLLKFGIEPFEVNLVKVTPTVTAAPSVKIDGKFLTVVSVEPNYSTLPSFKLTLANNSDKAVGAFSFKITINGKTKLSGMPQGDEGKALIEPGGIFQRNFPNVHQYIKVADGQSLPDQPNQIVTISNIVYKDGTFEGSRLDALLFLSLEAGRKMQVRQIIALLQANEKKPDYAEIVRQAENLGSAFNETDFNKFVAKVPDLSDAEKSGFRRSVESTLRHVKMRFIAELETAAREKSEMPLSKNWYVLNLERYRNWLARLD